MYRMKENCSAYLLIQLKPHGFSNIEAIDGSTGMQSLAQKKQLYKKYYIALLGAQHKAPIPDGKGKVINSKEDK